MRPASSPIRSGPRSPSNRAERCSWTERSNPAPNCRLRGTQSASNTWAMPIFEPQRRPRPPVADHQYELETKRVRVAVRPAYLHDQSDPEDDRYVWSYTVTIENRGSESVQLLSRYLNIVDGQGRIQEVRGAGVVGGPPGVGPGGSVLFTCGCPL